MTSGGFTHRFLRIALAVIVVIDLVSFLFLIADARNADLSDGAPINLLVDLLSRAPSLWLIVAGGTAGAVMFGRKQGGEWPGLLALGALTVLSTIHAQLFGSPFRHLYFSGLCLAGWLLGLAFARRRGTPMDETCARIGATALLGASYFNAGISKIVYGGVDWASGLPIQAIIVGQGGMVDSGWIGAYRVFVASTPAAAGFFSLVTIVLELAGPLMLIGRRTRLLVALGLFGMHLNIYVLTPILYWQSMVLLLLFGLSADDPYTPPKSPIASLTDNRKFARVAGLFAIAAVAAVGHQGQRWTHTLNWTPGPPPSVEPPPALGNLAPLPVTAAPEPTWTPIQRIGPFAVGQALTPRWSIESFEVNADGFMVTVSGQPGRARFELTCASSPYNSPFDLGEAHIFYTNDLEFGVLQDAGLALQEEIRRATQGHVVCEDIARWRAAAQVAPTRPSLP